MAFPDMSQMAYNSWLSNYSNKLNSAAYALSQLPSQYYSSLLIPMVREKIACDDCEMAIYRSRMVNRDPIIRPSYVCAPPKVITFR